MSAEWKRPLLERIAREIEISRDDWWDAMLSDRCIRCRLPLESGICRQCCSKIHVDDLQHVWENLRDAAWDYFAVEWKGFPDSKEKLGYLMANFIMSWVIEHTIITVEK